MSRARVGRELEREIQRSIRIALGLEPDLVLWRNNVGKAETVDGRRIKYGLANGSADLIGVLRIMVDGRKMGRFFALEIKTPRGTTDDDQDVWLALVRDAGGFAAVVRSAQEARAALERARKGEYK